MLIENAKLLGLVEKEKNSRSKSKQDQTWNLIHHLQMADSLLEHVHKAAKLIFSYM